MIATDFDEGLLVGLMVGEGHFGGDGRQPQITLRLHVRHEALLDWLDTRFPGGKRYGPYHHGDRHYYQWMARGAYLREVLVPLLTTHITPELDGHAYARLAQMVERYSAQLGRPRTGPAEGSPEARRSDPSALDPPDPDRERGSRAGDTAGAVGTQDPAQSLERGAELFQRLRQERTD